MDMTHASGPGAEPVQRSLPELLARYLQGQAAAHTEGLGFAEVTADVVPYEAVPAHPTDPRPAWAEARAAARWFQPTVGTMADKAPPDWPALVAGLEPTAALPMALGNFPQLVRDLHTLLQTPDLRTLRPTAGQPFSSAALLDWAEHTGSAKRYPEALLAVGVLRLARQVDHAAELLQQARAGASAEWAAALANEEAALLWQRGSAADAGVLWQKQTASVPVLFNRGMAALFLGQPVEARSSLREAAEQLPEESAWHHLARLYLALSEMRGTSAP
jgi:tetratricopeptide (TPR) repeat protein